MSVQVSTLASCTRSDAGKHPVCVECGQHEETLPDGTPYGGWGLWFGKYCSRCALTTGKTTEAEDE